MSATGSRDAGMTLLEALVVVAVTAMVGAIVFPNLSRALDGLNLHRAAAGVAADLRLARADAVRRDAPVQFALADRKLPAALSLSGSPMTFYPDGSASGGEVVVASARRRIAVEVDPATGAVALGPS